MMDGKPVGAVRVSFGYMSTVDDSLVSYTYLYCHLTIGQEARCFNGFIETGPGKFYTQIFC